MFQKYQLDLPIYNAFGISSMFLAHLAGHLNATNLDELW